ncbi:MAG: hypothetical protein ABFE08_07110 [Armatimonadia bacterium]
MSLLTVLGSPPFTPRSLFRSTSTIGAIYDYDDFSYLYQKADGSVPITALEQPVGLVVDQRWGGVLGSELLATGTTGLVGTSTAASYKTSTGAGSVTRVDVSNQSYVKFGVTASRWYRISVTNTGPAQLLIRDISGTTILSTFATIASGASFTGYIPAISGICFCANAGSLSFTLTSIRELPGLHAYQSTDAARPVLSARYNLLVGTATLATQSVTTLAASYTLTFTGSGTVTLSGTATGVKSAGTNVFTATAGTLTLTVSGSVRRADLRLTADANSRIPAYQRVDTSTSYDSAGFPRFLRIDATDDFLQTASVDPGTDKVFVCAGVTKVSDAATQIVVELSSNTATKTNAFLLISTTAPAIAFGSKGTTYKESTKAVPAGPVTAVASLLGDIGAPSVSGRVNGDASTPTTTTQGTAANYGPHPIYIGARAGTSLRLNNGRIYPMVICFKAVTAGEIAATEAWVNARTRAY